MDSPCASTLLRLAAISLLMLGLVAPDLGAQRLSELSTGVQVRVRTERATGWRLATLLAVTADSIHVLDGERSLAIARRELQAVGFREPNARQSTYATTGVMAGAALGVVTGWLAKMRCERDPNSDGLCPLAGIVVGVPAVLLGGLMGGVLGHDLPKEEWHRVELP